MGHICDTLSQSPQHMFQSISPLGSPLHPQTGKPAPAQVYGHQLPLRRGKTPLHGFCWPWSYKCSRKENPSRVRFPPSVLRRTQMTGEAMKPTCNLKQSSKLYKLARQFLCRKPGLKCLDGTNWEAVDWETITRKCPSPHKKELSSYGSWLSNLKHLPKCP